MINESAIVEDKSSVVGELLWCGKSEGNSIKREEDEEGSRRSLWTYSSSKERVGRMGISARAENLRPR